MAEDNDNLIRGAPLLARLSSEDIHALAAGGRRREYDAGAIIFRQGAPGDSLHVIMEGEVRVVRGAADGAEVTLSIMRAGEIFGEMALLDGHARSATIIAATRTKTFIVSRLTFVAWLAERPPAALVILETLASRIRRSNDSLADRFFLDVGQRLAKHLVEAAAVAPGGRIKTTQASIAHELGVTRESVNKQLKQFERHGWVELGRGSITVQDVAGLQASVGG